MRFDCGETYAEKVKRLGTWHRFFAVCAVEVGPHDCRIFEYVERRRIRYELAYLDGWCWEYRAIKGRLENVT